MTDLIVQMTGLAQSAQLRQLMAELEAAVETGDPAGIARADHALRTGLMALMGTLSLDDRESAAGLDLLEELVEALRRTIDRLSTQAARQARSDRCNLVYLRTDGAGKLGR